MKANELMIGDLVRYKENYPDKKLGSIIARVLGISNFIMVRTTDGKYDEVNPDWLEPIPLTAEILEKNGFTRFGTDYILKDRHFGLKNPSTPDNYLDNYWLRVSIKAVHIESIHELQHCLNLVGIKKDIVL